MNTWSLQMLVLCMQYNHAQMIHTNSSSRLFASRVQISSNFLVPFRAMLLLSVYLYIVCIGFDGLSFSIHVCYIYLLEISTECQPIHSNHFIFFLLLKLGYKYSIQLFLHLKATQSFMQQSGFFLFNQTVSALHWNP